MENLAAKYDEARTTRSSINENLDVLYKYARECDVVLELGVRQCVSSWAFLKALADRQKDNKKSCVLISNDLCKFPEMDGVRDAARAAGVDYRLVFCNDLDLDVRQQQLDDTSVDACFIDTWHVYGQLKRELAKFAPLTRKYIMLHDTEVDKTLGESIRCNFDVDRQARATGYPKHEITQGLQRAVAEFLQSRPDWEVREHRTNNNGLTVLAKK